VKNLNNKVVVITGSAQGIGYAIAEQCAAEGMKIVMSDIDKDTLATSTDSIAAKDVETLSVKADVGELEDVQNLLDKTLEKFGAVHVLINNAGLFGTPNAAWDQSQEDWDLAINVNINGVLNGVRTFIPQMLRQDEECHVVNIASIMGHIVQPFLAPYGMTKFAVTGLTESIYHELQILESKVGISLACPGFVKTNILSGEDVDRKTQMSAHAKKTREFFESRLADAVLPGVIAEQIIQAMKDKQFYVFTNPETRPYLEDRLSKVLAFGDTNPDFDEETLSRFRP